MNLRLACLQAPATDHPDGAPDPVADRRANLAALADAAAGAAEGGARLLITPEMYLTGYNLGAEVIAGLAEERFGPSQQEVSAIAAKHGIAILYGYPERDGDGVVYNAVQLIGGDGAPRRTTARRTCSATWTARRSRRGRSWWCRPIWRASGSAS